MAGLFIYFIGAFAGALYSAPPHCIRIVMPAAPAAKSRKWCFTMFWDLDAYEEKGPGPAYFEDWECEYLYVGLEVCPKTGRPHYQGYIRFLNTQALGGVRKLFTHQCTNATSGKLGYAGHWEACKGSEAQNVKYCAKDEDLVIEFGDREASEEVKDDKSQGKRNDINAVRALVARGGGMLEVVSTTSSYQAIKIAETMLKYLEPRRDWKPEVWWIYGPPGVGKSMWAHEMCVDPWTSGSKLNWFEGYDAHEDVIFDDFRENSCEFHVLLRLLDRYPYRVEVKGSSRQFLARRIFITSCLAPDKVYPQVAENLLQLGRRIDKIVFIERLGVCYAAPGSSIGLEPSVRYVLPERSSEQEVQGNTSEPTPCGSLTSVPEALDNLEKTTSESKCEFEHAPDEYCNGCVTAADLDEAAQELFEEIHCDYPVNGTQCKGCHLCLETTEGG